MLPAIYPQHSQSAINLHTTEFILESSCQARQHRLTPISRHDDVSQVQQAHIHDSLTIPLATIQLPQQPHRSPIPGKVFYRSPLVVPPRVSTHLQMDVTSPYFDVNDPMSKSIISKSLLVVALPDRGVWQL